MGTDPNVFRLVHMKHVNATDHSVQVLAPTNRCEPTTTREDISLAVDDWDGLGFVVPNGAGKTELCNRTTLPRRKLDDTSGSGSQTSSTWRETREPPVQRGVMK